jgi:hypothetical protein
MIGRALQHGLRLRLRRRELVMRQSCALAYAEVGWSWHCGHNCVAVVSLVASFLTALGLSLQPVRQLWIGHQSLDQVPALKQFLRHATLAEPSFARPPSQEISR